MKQWLKNNWEWLPVIAVLIFTVALFVYAWWMPPCDEFNYMSFEICG